MKLVHTISGDRLTREERRNLVEYPTDIERPRTRGDCGPLSACPHCGVAVHFTNGTTSSEPRRKNIHKTYGHPKDRNVPTTVRNIEPSLAGEMRVREGNDIDGWGPAQRKTEVVRVSGERESHQAWNVRNGDLQRVGGNAPEMPEHKGQELQILRGKGNTSMPALGDIRAVPGGYGGASAGPVAGTNGQREGVQPRELQVGDGQGTGKQQTDFTCPNCGGEVAHHLGVGASVGHWEKHDPHATGEGMARQASDLPATVFVKCRPCVFSSCKHHLHLDVNPTSGSIRLNFPTLEVDELAETCSLDVADRGGATLDQVGDLLNLTRERIRQVELKAIEHIAESPLIPASAGIFSSDP